MKDVIVIGGGIVGLATALKILEKKPQTRLLLLEKEVIFKDDLEKIFGKRPFEDSTSSDEISKQVKENTLREPAEPKAPEGPAEKKEEVKEDTNPQLNFENQGVQENENSKKEEENTSTEESTEPDSKIE